jgi:hypothetical protein
MPEHYAIKETRPQDIMKVINEVKNRYSDQLDKELILATSLQAIHEVGGKVKAMEHIFTELYEEITKTVLA